MRSAPCRRIEARRPGRGGGPSAASDGCGNPRRPAVLRARRDPADAGWSACRCRSAPSRQVRAPIMSRQMRSSTGSRRSTRCRPTMATRAGIRVDSVLLVQRGDGDLVEEERDELHAVAQRQLAIRRVVEAGDSAPKFGGASMSAGSRRLPCARGIDDPPRIVSCPPHPGRELVVGPARRSSDGIVVLQRPVEPVESPAQDRPETPASRSRSASRRRSSSSAAGQGPPPPAEFDGQAQDDASVRLSREELLVGGIAARRVVG